MTRFLLLGLALLAAGCNTGVPSDALNLSPDSLERRQLESRRFEGGKESDILSACSGVAQDMGFTIDEAETKLGVMVASKNREASDTGSRVAMAILFGANAANSMDRSQKIRLCIVVKPVQSSNGAGPAQWVVRATFQRMVWNSYGQLTRLEGLKEPELYQQFFEKLSKSVFLEAHKI
jgi:hypothetical protein